VKKTKAPATAEPRTKRNLKTASARVLQESQVLCGEETQAVLDNLDITTSIPTTMGDLDLRMEKTL
jgi:hypothetical protein